MLGIFGWKSPSGFSSSSTAEEVTEGIDGTGLTAIVTGATSGIGLETARVLALRGVHVIMAVRNVNAGREVKDAFLKEIPSAKIDLMELDLSSMASVRKFASEFISLGIPLNLLINNAGVLTMKPMVSKDNIELHFATNHLGHFLLTNLLLDTMKNTAAESNKEGRIVNVSSVAHKFMLSQLQETGFNEATFGQALCYGRSKLGNILHSNELARRLKEEGACITANSLHPGAIQTNVGRDQWFSEVFRKEGLLGGILRGVVKHFIKTLQQGAATTCYVALHPQVKGVSGKYFVDCNAAEPSNLAKDAELAKDLWDFSLRFTDPK